jgi:4-hydroxy-tetrahydrodipicolinate reductase
MVNVLISGANGRMGKKVFEAAATSDKVNAICGVDLSQSLSPDFPIYASFNDVKEKVEVVVDFSAPANLDNILNFCLKNKVGAVLCATGYSEGDVKRLKTQAKRLPFSVREICRLE